MTDLTYTALARRAAFVARAWTTWNRASLVFAIYAGTFIGSLCGVVYMAHESGRAEGLTLAYDAFAREAQYRSLTAALVDRCTIAMHVVLENDIYLHARIRSEVPDWSRLVAVARASVEDGP